MLANGGVSLELLISARRTLSGRIVCGMARELEGPTLLDGHPGLAQLETGG